MIPATNKRFKSSGTFTTSSSGFTLIELLVVIAIIGILATAVFAFVNPIEQTRRGSDTTLQTSSSEFLRATERFYAAFSCYPWQKTLSGCTGTAAPASTVMTSLNGGSVAGGALNSTFPELTDKAEIKPEFTKNTDVMSKLYVTQDSDDQVHVCFLPESKQFQDTAKTGGLQRDGTSTGCSGTTGTSGCHICLP